MQILISESSIKSVLPSSDIWNEKPQVGWQEPSRVVIWGGSRAGWCPLTTGRRWEGGEGGGRRTLSRAPDLQRDSDLARSRIWCGEQRDFPAGSHRGPVCSGEGGEVRKTPPLPRYPDTGLSPASTRWWWVTGTTWGYSTPGLGPTPARSSSALSLFPAFSSASSVSSAAL